MSSLPAKPRPKVQAINKDILKKPRIPTEEEVVSAEAVLSVIHITRHNFLAQSQAVQNHFGQVMKNGGQPEALAVMNAADVLRRFATPAPAPQNLTAPSGSSCAKPKVEENRITQSGCFQLNDAFKIGEKGLLAPPIESPMRARAPSMSGSPIDRENSTETTPSNPNTSLKSMRLEDLENIRLLGAGAQGKVWLKRWKVTGDLYAVKELTISKEMDKKQQDHVAQELKSLIHAPNDYIVPLYQAFLRANLLTIVQQYMDLGSLEDLLKDHPKLPEDCVASITLQLFQALREMSAVRKQLHRDIKPANILLSRKGEVKLADFGVASNIKTIGESSFIGTTTYMSPERIKGQRYTLPSDVWAVGLVASECVVGCYPFPYVNFMDLLDKVTSTDALVFPVGTPDDMARILWGCLVQDPDARITCDAALSSPWLVRHTGSSRDGLAAWIGVNVPVREESSPSPVV